MNYNDETCEMTIKRLIGVTSCDWENLEFEDNNTLVYTFGDYMDYNGDEYYYEIIYHLDSNELSIWKIFDCDRLDMILGNYSYSEIRRKMRELSELYNKFKMF